MRIVSTDWIPRCADAGYDAIIESLAPQGLDGEAFVAALNQAGSQPDFNTAMVITYISDRQVANALQSVEVADFGELPPYTLRYGAPGGLGTDGSGVWFGQPATGAEWVRWYVNGQLRAREQRDLAADRYMLLATIGAVAGDVVQIAIEAGGVVGWWARIVLP